MTKEKLLISGASGFIGTRLFKEIIKSKIPCVGIGTSGVETQNYYHCDLFESEKLRQLLRGVSCVVHCAGYAHAFHSHSSEVYQKTWLINYHGTKNLIQIAAEVGVKKFINLSSVKVMSEPDLNCVDETWDLNPDSEYGKSKLAAEKLIFEVALNYPINIINLRLSMVYGLGGKGNLERMTTLTSKRLFPPIPETFNHRSLVHVDDVVDVIIHMVKINSFVNDTFIITGPEAPSGREIYNKIRQINGFKKNDFMIPRGLFEYIAKTFDCIQKLLGRRLLFNTEVSNRLLNTAWYSSEKIKKNFGWQAKISLDDGLKEIISESKIL